MPAGCRSGSSVSPRTAGIAESDVGSGMTASARRHAHSVRPRHPGHTLQHALQVCPAYRLHEMAVDPGSRRPFLVFRLAPPGHCDDERLSARHTGPYAPRNLMPVDVRHSDVEQHHVRAACGHCGERFLAAENRLYRVTEQVEQGCERFRGIPIVVDD